MDYKESQALLHLELHLMKQRDLAQKKLQKWFDKNNDSDWDCTQSVDFIELNAVVKFYKEQIKQLHIQKINK